MRVGDDTREAVAWLENEFQRLWERGRFHRALDADGTVFHYGCTPATEEGRTGLMFSLRDDNGCDIVVNGRGKEMRL